MSLENCQINVSSEPNSAELLLNDINKRKTCDQAIGPGVAVYAKATTSQSLTDDERPNAKSSISSCNVCRICYEDSRMESLIAPCKCTGTMGLLHKSCIEKWLGSSNSNKCEICDFEFITVRRPKPLRKWLSAPSHRNDRRNFIGDFACFCFLSPLAGVSVWLCANGAMTYSKYKNYTWETVGLVVLSVFLIFIYLVWVAIAVRYHSRVITEWQNSNQQVHVLGLDGFMDETSADLTLSPEVSFHTPTSGRSSHHSSGSQHATSTALNIPLKQFPSTSQSLPEGDSDNFIVMGTHPDMGSYLQRYTPAKICTNTSCIDELKEKSSSSSSSSDKTGGNSKDKCSSSIEIGGLHLSVPDCDTTYVSIVKRPI